MVSFIFGGCFMLGKDAYERVVSGEVVLSRRGLERGLKLGGEVVDGYLEAWLSEGLVGYKNGVNNKNGYVLLGGFTLGGEDVRDVGVHIGDISARVGSYGEYLDFVHSLRGGVGERYVYVVVEGDLLIDGELILRGGVWRHGVGSGGVVDGSGVWVCSVFGVRLVGRGVECGEYTDVVDMVECSGVGGVGGVGGVVRFSRSDMGDEVKLRCGLLGVGCEVNLDWDVVGSLGSYLLDYFV